MLNVWKASLLIVYHIETIYLYFSKMTSKKSQSWGSFAPFLFLLEVEDLSKSIKKAVEIKEFSGIQILSDGLPMSNLSLWMIPFSLAKLPLGTVGASKQLFVALA